MDVIWRHCWRTKTESMFWQEHQNLVWLRASRIAWARLAWMQWIDEGGA